ncbi:hypothetical protein PNOK_0879000 [Pyrrhoderma noxium]|uniref:Uncharacterized protein n=1 Tax=Pyrrhoderma noxium TaxID=2282107 RepID=A0A286U8M7_9AGAM|nr:hypothetical protein PNOK_0879000 [Pyrrhoderma noxium]
MKSPARSKRMEYVYKESLACYFPIYYTGPQAILRAIPAHIFQQREVQRYRQSILGNVYQRSVQLEPLLLPDEPKEVSLTEALGVLVRGREKIPVQKEIEPLHVAKDNTGLPRGPRGLFSPTGTMRKTAYTFSTSKNHIKQLQGNGYSFVPDNNVPLISSPTTNPLEVGPSVPFSKPISKVKKETTSRVEPSVPTVNYPQEMFICTQTSTPSTSKSDANVETLKPPVTKSIMTSTNYHMSSSIKSTSSSVIRSPRPQKYVSENLLKLQAEIEKARKQVENIDANYKRLEEQHKRAKMLKKRIDEQQKHLETHVLIK